MCVCRWMDGCLLPPSLSSLLNQPHFLLPVAPPGSRSRSYPGVKTRRGQGPLVFPGGSGAKVNLARGQGWVVTAGPGGHPGGVRAVSGAGLPGDGGASSAACRQTPDALAAASLEGEMNSLLPSSVFSPEHLHSNWEVWAFSCFSARSCQPFPLPKRGLVVFFFLSPLLLVLCNLLPAVHPVRALLGFDSVRSIWRDLPISATA